MQAIMRAHQSDAPGGDVRQLEAHEVVFTAVGVLNLFVPWHHACPCPIDDVIVAYVVFFFIAALRVCFSEFDTLRPRVDCTSLRIMLVTSGCTSHCELRDLARMELFGIESRQRVR